MRVAGKVALISGGARGMGAEIAETLASEGARIVIGDRLVPEGTATAEKLRTAGTAVLFEHLDVTEPRSWDDLVARAVRQFGGIDVLVNNAGIVDGGSIERTDLAAWRRVMAVNLDGVYLGIRAALASLKERAALWPGGASIINTSSVAGMIGMVNSTAYSASKGGVRLLTKAAAVEFGEKKYRIRVNSVHPGFIDTPMLSRVKSQLVRRGRHEDEAAAEVAMAADTPLGRVGRPRDIANAALYLASCESAFVTGSELVVDGGFTAR